MRECGNEYTVRVFYEDVDLGGIVYHSKYLNFCERARSDIFFSRGLSPVNDDYHFVVKHIDADFIASGRFGEQLIVYTRLLAKKRASFTLNQTVYEKKRKTKLFEMQLQLVCMKGQKVSAIPSGMLDLFESN